MFAIQFKDDVDPEDLKKMSYGILIILLEFAIWCKKHSIPCVISSLMGDAPGRVSRTHADGRAFDASIRGMTTDHIDDILIEFNRKYAATHGTDPTGKNPRVVICHGKVQHLHFQVRHGI